MHLTEGKGAPLVDARSALVRARRGVWNTLVAVRDPLSHDKVLGARGLPAVMIRRASVVTETATTEGENSHHPLEDTE